ncbi:phage protein NinX family protein [Bosea sp. TWI1241]|uniref:phage protein NinX family protein n=1 Tax=Bosea sp. TWI1241 TaxID=3148904 RepID=UPI003209BF69
MKTNELAGGLLDYWVAKAERKVPLRHKDHWFVGLEREEAYAPSTNWAHGGPIIERERIVAVYDELIGEWEAFHKGYLDRSGELQSKGDCIAEGETHLIAAMRCYVASKLGDTVDTPQELAA